MELIDINPTLCDLTGLATQENIDAKSFAPILRGQNDEHRAEAVSIIRGFSLIRTRTHKFVDHHNAGTELYDLANDPDELHNIVADNPSLIRELRGRLNDHIAVQQWRR